MPINELELLALLGERLLDIGDDTAVVASPTGPLLLAADALVEGVHADLRLTGIDDLGWKALAVNVSDVAAMGGRPLHALVTVGLPEGRGGDLAGLYDGLLAAAEAYGCTVVGGDLTLCPVLALTVAVTGTIDDGGPGPVWRSGACPGDTLFVTGSLGAAAAGLRRIGSEGTGAAGPDVDAHRRPQALVDHGRAARHGGARAMIDVSDGLALDLGRLATASGVGVIVEHVPVAEGATFEEALGGGDDYQLLMAAPDPERLLTRFRGDGLALPVAVGRCTGDQTERRLGGGALPAAGWEHRW